MKEKGGRQRRKAGPGEALYHRCAAGDNSYPGFYGSLYGLQSGPA